MDTLEKLEEKITKAVTLIDQSCHLDRKA